MVRRKGESGGKDRLLWRPQGEDRQVRGATSRRDTAALLDLLSVDRG